MKKKELVMLLAYNALQLELDGFVLEEFVSLDSQRSCLFGIDNGFLTFYNRRTNVKIKNIKNVKYTITRGFDEDEPKDIVLIFECRKGVVVRFSFDECCWEIRNIIKKGEHLSSDEIERFLYK